MQRTVVRSFVAIVITAVMVVTLWRPVTVTGQGSSGNGLKVKTRNELVVEPGESQEFEVSVQNVTAAPVDAVVDFNDFVVDPNETGSIKLILDDETTTEYSLKSFLSGPDRIPLGPGEEINATYTITMPSDATPGPYYGAVRFTAVPEGSEDLTGAVLSASVASILLAQVPGNIVELLTLEEISAVNGDKTGAIFQSPPDAVQIRLNNEGNAFSKPFGRVAIKNWSGDEIYAYEINQNEPRGNVLPSYTRKFVDQIPEDTLSSVGRYTIEANISYGDGGNVISASTSFWVLPWSVVVGAVVGVLALILIVTRGIPAYNRRVVQKSRGSSISKKS